jgi:hypothetical protein
MFGEIFGRKASHFSRDVRHLKRLPELTLINTRIGMCFLGDVTNNLWTLILTLRFIGPLSGQATIIHFMNL